MGKTVFLDRDGVINRCAPPQEYIRYWEDFAFLPGVPEAIRLLNEAGYRVALVTNQRGVARGLLTMADLDRLHQRMKEALQAQGAHIDDIYVCPHEAGTCQCRKPGTGLFLRAEEDRPVDKATSWMVGDFESDIQAGKSYGVKTILIGRGDFGQDVSCASLLEAAERILTHGQ